MNNNNLTIYDELRKDLFGPFISFLFCSLHMIVMCYLTLIFWFAVLPRAEFNLVSFFIDWHLLAAATFPIMYFCRKLFSKSLAFFIYLVLVFVAFFLLAPVLASAMHTISQIIKVDGYHSVLMYLLW